MSGEGVSDTFDFSDSEIRQAVREGRLLSLELEFTRACNYLCPYCYAAEETEDAAAGAEETGMDTREEGETAIFPISPSCVSSASAGFPAKKGELSGEEILSVLKQAAALGARKIVLLGGEPLLHPDLTGEIRRIRELGMHAEIFTNGSLVTEELARELHRLECRVAVKLNSLDSSIHDQMTGIRDSLRTALQALEILQKAGYAATPDLLGAATVLSTLNLREAPEIWRFLRERKIRPYFECMTPQGRLLEHNELLPAPEELEKVFCELARIDREYGYEWSPQPPLAGQKCLRHLYSCVVKSNGNVIPCVGLDCVIGSIREKPLADILKNSRILARLKDHRKYIKEPCRSCDKAEHCYGCRGTAWQMTGDFLAADPSCWRNAGRLSEIRTLPANARELIPHKGKMALVDELVKLGDGTGETLSLIRDDNLFLDENGFLSPEALIEYAAQSAAALDSFENSGNISSGLLTGILSFSFGEKRAARGDRIRVFLRKEDELGEWNILSFRIFKNASPLLLLAEGKLKLCIPQLPQ